MNWKKLFNRKKDKEYICFACGEKHGGWPALTFNSPSNYSELTEEEKNDIAAINSDFCVIKHPDQTDRFIRVKLQQKVNDAEEDLDYGLWVSLSEKSFDDYHDNYENDNHETSYFGWLCNKLPDYDNTMGIPTTVVTQKGNQRPIIFPHKDHDHAFVRDFYDGIISHEAQRRVNDMLKNNVG